MPINYKEYPKDWKLIVARIKQRANNCCESCGLPNYIIGYRQDNGKFVSLEHLRPYQKRKYIVWENGESRVVHLWGKLPNGKKLIQIRLTIAHLDHDHRNHQVTDDRLKALCQDCHLRYDLARHIRKRKYGMGVYEQPTLFEKEEFQQTIK